MQLESNWTHGLRLEKLNHIGSLVSAANAFTQDITHPVWEMLCLMRMGGRMCVDLTGSWIVGFLTKKHSMAQ